jgi:hypothetical protein
MSAERVVELLDHLESRGLNVWVDGGWEVDALPELERVLGELEYRTTGGGAPKSFEMTDPSSTRTTCTTLTPSPLVSISIRRIGAANARGTDDRRPGGRHVGALVRSRRCV